MEKKLKKQEWGKWLRKMQSCKSESLRQTFL
jgi:hypothetical protein